MEPTGETTATSPERMRLSQAERRSRHAIPFNMGVLLFALLLISALPRLGLNVPSGLKIIIVSIPTLILGLDILNIIHCRRKLRS